MNLAESGIRLQPSTMTGLPDEIGRPNYTRTECKIGIVHIGVGAFHRGHQAWYTDTVLNANGGDWSILGVSLRSDRAQQQLRPQAGLYTLVQRNGETVTKQIIGAIQDVLCAPQDTHKILEAIAAADTKIISLTITEKGYGYDPATGGLGVAQSDIAADLETFRDQPHTQQPESALGFLIAGLQRRRATSNSGLTLLSCDNLSNNGDTLKAVVTDFARRVDPQLSSWILSHVSFPNSVVDRMVPAITASDLAALTRESGLKDPAAVFTETFSQWIIEDRFIAGRPEWELAGAVFVSNAKPFEQAKLRLLNGSHSLIAYLGQLSGYQHVHEVVSDKLFAELLERFMEEVVPELQMPEDFDLNTYQRQLLQRFANPALKHRTAQIAEDGSQKIRQRWLETVRPGPAEAFSAHALALAGWAKFLEQSRDNGETYLITDPLADELLQVLARHETAPIGELLNSIGLQHITSQLTEFLALADGYLKQLQKQGSQATIKAFLAETL